MRIFLLLSGVLGATGVLAGAFGAHALRERLEPLLLHTWETAVLYQLVHAVALLFLAVGIGRGGAAEGWLARAGWSWVAGIVLFSGSLYALALGGPRLLGPVTPLGGVAFVVGWLCLVVAWTR